jgi:hypothetical protein
MSAPRSPRRKVAASQREAFATVHHASNNLLGSAAIMSAAIEGIGGDENTKDAVRFSADRLLQSDVEALREAVAVMENTRLEGIQ